MEDNFETTNIHLEWLVNIKTQLIEIQNMQRLASEGCRSLGDYLNIPFELKDVVIPDIQYKNIRFMALEISILLDNLSPILKEKVKEYNKKIKPILNCIDDKKLFLQFNFSQGRLVKIEVLDFFNKTFKYLVEIKSGIIKDIGHILYLPEGTEKKW